MAVDFLFRSHGHAPLLQDAFCKMSSKLVATALLSGSLLALAQLHTRVDYAVVVLTTATATPPPRLLLQPLEALRLLLLLLQQSLEPLLLLLQPRLSRQILLLPC